MNPFKFTCKFFPINSTPSILSVLMWSVLCYVLAASSLCTDLMLGPLDSLSHFTQHKHSKTKSTKRPEKWPLKRLKNEHTSESPFTTASSHLLQTPKHVPRVPYGSQGWLLNSISYRQNCMWILAKRHLQSDLLLHLHLTSSRRFLTPRQTG